MLNAWKMVKKMKQWLKYEEIKTLRSIGVLATVLVGLNLWLYYDNGIYLKFTIPLGVATILLFVLKNTALSFLLALLISCICLKEAPASEFLLFIRAQLDYTILTVLVIGGFMALLTRSGASEQLNIYIRKWCKTVKSRKLAGVGITAINCFSSTATVAAMHLLFSA